MCALSCRSHRNGNGYAGRAALCGDRARHGEFRGLGYAAPLGRSLVRETRFAVLDDGFGVQAGLQLRPCTALAGGATQPGFSCIFLVAPADRVERAGGVLLNCDAGRERRLAGLQPCRCDRSAARGFILRRGHALDALDRASGTEFVACCRSLPRTRNNGEAIGTAGAVSAGARDRVAQMVRLAAAGAGRSIQRLRAALVHSVHVPKRDRGAAYPLRSAGLLAFQFRCAPTRPALVVLFPDIAAAALSLVSVAGPVSGTLCPGPTHTNAHGHCDFWVRFFLGVAKQVARVPASIDAAPPSHFLASGSTGRNGPES